MDLLLTDRSLDADEALALGIAARVLPDDELLTGARALAAEVAARSTTAARTVKRLLAASLHAEKRAHLDAERDAIAAAAVSPDGVEGVAAFLEKRTPTFNA
jgi:2-(1,2-epoxy-1,2-dihydrophenyl)acetyl-CoA isomerase